MILFLGKVLLVKSGRTPLLKNNFSGHKKYSRMWAGTHSAQNSKNSTSEVRDEKVVKFSGK